MIRTSEIDKVADSVQADFSLSKIQTNRLSDEILLTALLFYPTTNLSQRISENLALDQDKADEINAFISGKIFAPLNYLYDDTDKLFEGGAVTQPPTTTDLQSEIDAAEAELQALAPIRTMADDMKSASVGGVKENTYVSNQSSLLGDSTIKPIAKPTGRWESHDQ